MSSIASEIRWLGFSKKDPASETTAKKLRWWGWSSWCVLNFIVLAASLVWMVIDPSQSGIASDVRGDVGLSMRAFIEHAIHLSGIRWIAMWCLLSIAVGSLLACGFLLLVGHRRDRSIRSWILLTSAIALWITFLGCWHEIGWFGKRWRAAAYVEHFIPVVRALEQRWPKRDGERAELGSFLAYPTGAPRSLILMTCPAMPKGTPTFNGVERTPDGGMGFPLIGIDGGDWLEWHPATSRPESYSTGLRQYLHLRRSTDLGDGWYLVRYQS